MAQRSHDVRPWAGGAALAFLLLVLITLVIVPVLVQSRVDTLRTDIEASEPARTLINTLRFNLAREMAALTDVLVSGDTANAARYRQAYAAEQKSYAELTRLASRIGGEVPARLVDAQRITDAWHVRTVAAVQVLTLPGALDTISAERDPVLFEDVLRATAVVDSAIVNETASVRQRIAETERAGLMITVSLGILALFGGGAAAELYRRVQRFSTESERRRSEAERALHELEQAEAARVRLIRGVTHDVKNPIGAASGYAELLALGVKTPLLPEQAPLVEGIQRSLGTALAIISDLLDVARADSNGLMIRYSEADLVATVQQAVEENRAAVEAAGHVIEFAPRIDTFIANTDAARVKQVLANLISNASKYTPEPGQIRVIMTSSGDVATIRVEDSGPGVPPDQADAIFGEFTRLHDGSATRGHGLGLAIARRIARLLGGDLVAEKRAGPGAVFILTIPGGPPLAADAPRSGH